MVTTQPTDMASGEFIPELWSSRIIDHVRTNLVCLNVIDTTWKEQLALGDKVNIQLLTALSTTNVDTSNRETAHNEANTISGGTTSITVDVWRESVVMMDDCSKIQTHIPGLLEKIASNAAYALEKYIDTAVNALFDDLTSTWAGSDAQTFTDDIMIDLMEGLDEADVPRENRSLVIDPSTIADIYKIDKFVHLDYQKVAVIPAGKIGGIYGVPVYVTNNLYSTGTTGAIGALLHKEAIGMVMQQHMAVEKWRAHSAASDVIAVRALYGIAVLRQAFGNYFYTRKA